jgi:predicted DNA-binding transcriptional regulator AlpA
MDLRLKNAATSGQRIAPDTTSPYDGNLDTDLDQLIKRLMDGKLCSAEQLNILHRVQTRLVRLTSRSSQAKDSASPLLHVSQEYLKPKEAAAYLTSSASTLAKRRLYGGGPKWSRIGTAIRYRKTDLDEWMSQHVVSSTSEESEQ